MISGKRERRGRALFWATVASAALHLFVLTVVLYQIARLIIPRGEPESVGRRETVSITKVERVAPPPPPHRARRVAQQLSPPAKTPRRELFKETTAPAPRARLRRTPPLPSKLERDEAGFARDVAALNAQNDPHAIPTIDPSARQSSTKSYSFDIPSSMHGEQHGNGIITPVQSWHEGGRDCYYGRYDYWYPDGATESGNIVWPFCFDPDSDPFKKPPHPIPFPLPLIGFKLPPNAEMPPIERQVYQEWAASNGASTP